MATYLRIAANDKKCDKKKSAVPVKTNICAYLHSSISLYLFMLPHHISGSSVLGKNSLRFN